MVTDCTIKRDDKTYFEIRNEVVTFFPIAAQQQRYFSNIGIPIPAHLQKDFGGQQFVTKNHPFFARALVEIHFPNVLQKMRFQMLFLKNTPPPPVNKMQKLKIDDQGCKPS